MGGEVGDAVAGVRGDPEASETMGELMCKCSGEGVEVPRRDAMLVGGVANSSLEAEEVDLCCDPAATSCLCSPAGTSLSVGFACDPGCAEIHSSCAAKTL